MHACLHPSMINNVLLGFPFQILCRKKSGNCTSYLWRYHVNLTQVIKYKESLYMFWNIFSCTDRFVYARFEDFRFFQVYIFAHIIKVFVMGKYPSLWCSLQRIKVHEESKN